MAFVGPMTMALALGALALFDDEDTPLPRREARLGPLKLSWPDHPLLYLAAGLFALVALPQLIVNTIQLRWTFNLGHRLVTLPGALVMLPYIGGFVAYFALIGRLRTKAPLYLNIAATLCGLATLPYPFMPLELDLMRRSELSVAQAAPFTNEATARCQISSPPLQASDVIAAEVASMIKRTPSNASLRSMRSVTAPMNAPNSAIGRIRSMVSMVTMNAEPVT